MEFNNALKFKNNTTDNKKSNWSLTIEPGVTNIDFSPKTGSSNTSGPYKLDGKTIDINSNFIAYDSREAYFPPSAGPFTDQANRYLVTITNENNGLLLTAGLIHDKRQQVDNAGNTFRYVKGGGEFSALIGKQIYATGSSINNGGVSAQFKVGGFVSNNNLLVNMTDNAGNTYISNNTKRGYSGQGFVAIASMSYDLIVNKNISVSLSANVMYMAGQAFSKVSVNNQPELNTMSIKYSNFSQGVGLNFKFRR